MASSAAGSCEITTDLAPEGLCARLHEVGGAGLILDGRAGAGWVTRVAAETRTLLEVRARDGRVMGAALDSLDRTVGLRRARGGTSGTGIAVLLAYDALDARPGLGPGETPSLLALEVNASLRLEPGGPARIEAVHEGAPAFRDAVLRRLDSAPSGRPARVASAAGIGAPRTSLPRERYLRAVERVKERIRAGDIYQANLTQMFEASWRGDPLDLYMELAAVSPAPRSAYLETEGFALASVSPETFIVVSPEGTVETCPIKGTRPRGGTAAEDGALVEALLASEKDRAELLMIVDLERNDLGRVCEVGSVEVQALWSPRTYAAVHHLVATIRGRLRPETGVRELLEAVFPGGSVTGAPKLRAIDILRELEPVPRGLYTGALFWFGDDGTTESSLLIRSVVFARGRAWIGAGGGVVADSDPESEWREANEKARPLARVVGFVPEEAR